MKLAIIGLPSSGKTTVFNALSGQALPTGVPPAPGRTEVHTAVAEVPDDRLHAVAAVFRPKKVTPAQVTFADIAGLPARAGRQGLPGALVNQLATMDGLVHVVRAFDDPAAPHPLGRIDPAADEAAMEQELLLHDQLAVERRLERLAEERQKVTRDKGEIEREQALFESLRQTLDDGRPLRSLALAAEEARRLTGYDLLSRLPMLIVVNLAEGAAEPELPPPPAHVGRIALQGKLEMEIAQLADDEAAAFLDEYGLTEPGRRRLLRACYALLGRLTFFTGSDPEVRAWTLPSGATALQAAETIHSDLARGFIRAEVIPADELVRLGGMAPARAQGRLRQEGKDYRVADGDVIHIKFNV